MDARLCRVHQKEQTQISCIVDYEQVIGFLGIELLYQFTAKMITSHNFQRRRQSPFNACLTALYSSFTVQRNSSFFQQTSLRRLNTFFRYHENDMTPHFKKIGNYTVLFGFFFLPKNARERFFLAELFPMIVLLNILSHLV